VRTDELLRAQRSVDTLKELGIGSDTLHKMLYREIVKKSEKK